MGLIEKLASRERVRTALHALDDNEVRALAIRYRVAVPGFRSSQAPFGLILRALARACWNDRNLRRDIDKALTKRVGAAAKRREGAEPRALIADMRTASPTSLDTVLVGMTDSREDVRKAAESALDAFSTGKRPLPRSTRPARPAAPRPPLRAPGPARGERAEPPKRDERVEALRGEVTKQEKTIRRLRDQLVQEKAAHDATKTALRDERPGKRTRAKTGGDAASPHATALAQRVREMEQVLRDYAIVLRGSDRLLALLEQASANADDEVSRPQKPTATTSLAPTEKIGTATDEQNWPKRFWEFLGRVATRDYVVAVTPIDCRGGRSSRVLFTVPPGAVVAQYSDGERAARFLVDTTATTPAMLLWIRRDLADSVLPTS